MLSGVFNAAFRYITASSGSTGSGNGGCSTAEEEGKSTAMTSTAEADSSSDSRAGEPLLTHHHHTLGDRLKKSLAVPQASTTTTTTTTGLLDQLLLIDEQITSSIGVFARPKTRPQRIVRSLCKVLEISGHGVPWFCGCGLLLLLYLYVRDRTLLDYGLNMLTVLVVDILVVAPIKLLFKRPRPHLNAGSIPMSVSSVDSYAFPSGHTTRCVALAAYFCYMPPFNPWTHLWYIWGLLVSLSRVALGRHHVLDVGAGMVMGLVIFDIVRRLGLLFGV